MISALSKGLGYPSFKPRNVKKVIVCALCFIFLSLGVYACGDEADNLLCHIEDSNKFISYCPKESVSTPPSPLTVGFTLTSSSADGGFDPGRVIPDNFKDIVRRVAEGASTRGDRCNGGNEFPKLTWENIPDGAEALVLIVEDSTGGNWVHLNAWYNKPADGALPAEIAKLSVADPTTLNNTDSNIPAFPTGWQTGMNSWSTLTDSDQVRPHGGWGGPCPAMGTGTHTYHFKLYALNAQVDNASPIDNMTRAAFESSKANTPQIIGQTEISGTASFASAPPSPPLPTAFALTSSSGDDGFDPGMAIPDDFKDIVRRVAAGTSTRGHQCSGRNEFPKLTWTNIPSGAEALVLVVEDETNSNWVHLNAWYNKPAGGTLPTEIAKLSVTDLTTLNNTASNVPAFPSGWQTGMNSWSTLTGTDQVRPHGGWAGPCPAAGTGAHTYYFKLYALNAQVDHAANPINGMTRNAFEMSSTYMPQIMGQTEISGTASFTSAPPSPPLPPAFALTSSSADDGFDPGMAIPDDFKDIVRRVAAGTSTRGHQCSGRNEFPKLTWENIPSGAEALVLVVEDETNSNWVHLNAWYNKPAGGTLPTEIAKLSVSDLTTLDNTASNIPAFTTGWQTGMNSWSTLTGTDQVRPHGGWAGPCPAAGTGTHTYYFKLYALNAQVDHAANPINGMTRNAFEMSSTYMPQIMGQTEISGTASFTSAPPSPPLPPAFALTSSSADDGFDPGMAIPDDFKDIVRRVAAGTSTRGHQCSGRNEFPKLTWTNIPSGAEALVLVVEDETNSNWVHLNAWYNKPAGGTLPTEIAKLSVTDLTTLNNTASNVPAFPSGWQTGMNSWSTLTGTDQVRPHGGWAGPCPAAGTGTHTYYFKLYALNAQVDHAANPINGMTRNAFEMSSTYMPQIMGQAEISGTAAHPLTLTSSSADDGFDPGMAIPDDFKDIVRRVAAGTSTRGHQCSGRNEFPKLTWENIPSGAEALVLVVEDETNSNWVHLNAWYNKPAGGTLPTEIAKLSVTDLTTLTNTASNIPAFPTGWQTGMNSWSTLTGTDQVRPHGGWAGPCPAAGTGAHTYYFKLYALNAQVDHAANPINGMTRNAFEMSSTYMPQIMGQAEISGTAAHPLTLTSSSADDGFDPGMAIPDDFKDIVRRVAAGTSTRGHQCSGRNEFPKLTWENIPSGAEALVLVVEDETNSNWVHLNAWYNKPAGGTLPTEIAKLSVTDLTTLTNTASNIPAFPTGWQTGMNSWSTLTGTDQVRPHGGWAGPCPAAGTGTHTYYFKLYALNAQVDHAANPINGMTRANFEGSATYASQIIDQAEISGTAAHPLTLTSSSADDGFDPGMAIPDDFKDIVRRVAAGTSTRGHQCSGRNEFPKLTWANVPAGAEALVLIVEDPVGGNWVHLNAWYNKPAGGTLPTEIAKLSVTDLTTLDNTDSDIPAFPTGWQTGMNSWSTLTGTDQVRPHGGWAGPCPPAGTGTHTYYFKLYALNTQVDHAANPINGMTRANFEGSATYASQIIDQAEISGTAAP